MSLRSIRRFGRASALLALALTGCIYGFAGGGLPSHVRTVAVIPFDNQTAVPELTRELVDQLRKGLHQRLGLRDAAEARATAVVRGSITKYEPDVPTGFSADPNKPTTSRRRVQLTVDVEIVDQTSGKTLLKKQGMSAEGEYDERNEASGRKQAIEKIVNDVIEGAQSQW